MKTKKTTAVVVLVAILAGNLPLMAQDVNPQAQEVKRDYYLDGTIAAWTDYAGVTALIGGFASGILLGFIGWGLGYLFIAVTGADVPSHRLIGMDSQDRRDFQEGYKAAIIETRKQKFNAGAMIGTGLVVMNAYLALDSEP